MQRRRTTRGSPHGPGVLWLHQQPPQLGDTAPGSPAGRQCAPGILMTSSVPISPCFQPGSAVNEAVFGEPGLAQGRRGGWWQSGMRGGRAPAPVCSEGRACWGTCVCPSWGRTCVCPSWDTQPWPCFLPHVTYGPTRSRSPGIVPAPHHSGFCRVFFSPSRTGLDLCASIFRGARLGGEWRGAGPGNGFWGWLQGREVGASLGGSETRFQRSVPH